MTLETSLSSPRVPGTPSAAAASDTPPANGSRPQQVDRFDDSPSAPASRANAAPRFSAPQSAAAQPLTRKSLAAWAAAPGLSAAEQQDRSLAQARIEKCMFGGFLGMGKSPDLNLRNLRALRNLPPGLRIKGDLDCSGCIALTTLQDAHAGGRLFCYDCTALTTLQDVHAGRDLDCDDCTALTTLQDVHAGRDLDCDDCTALTTLQDVHAGGYLYCRGCTALTGLPAAILQWPTRANGRRHDILLENTGISPQTRARIEAWQQTHPEHQGVRLHWSAPREVRADDFASLQAAWDFWVALLPQSAAAAGALVSTTVKPAIPTLQAAEQSVLQVFLGRLRGTAEYQNASSRSALAQRAIALGEALQAQAATGWVAEAVGVLDTATGSCGDRIIRGLEEVEISLRIYAAAQGAHPDKALRDLAVQLLKLDIVRQHAYKKVNKLVSVDEVEVFLAYETKLADRLQLPIKTRAMLYGAPVSRRDLKRAARDATRAASDDQRVQQFLKAWEPWQRFLRQQTTVPAWNTLESVALQAAHQQERCPITQNTYAELSEPVTLAPAVNMARLIAEYGSLRQWWEQHGTHPITQQPLKWSHIRRLPTAAATPPAQAADSLPTEP